MLLRTYNGKTDFESIKEWVQDERTHSLWCANRFRFPLERENFETVLQKNAEEWGSRPWMITDDRGTPIGFCAYNINVSERSAFLTFIILDKKLRGQGCGTRMMQFLSDYLLGITGISSVRLYVFDANKAAVSCYRKAGFIPEGIEKNAFLFHGEPWGRCGMTKYENPVH